MEISVKSFFSGLNPHKLIDAKQKWSVHGLSSSSLSNRTTPPQLFIRKPYKCLHPVSAVASGGVQDVKASSSSSQFEGFSVMTATSGETGELTVGIEVSGDKTRVIFEEVFDKMVEAAQPIPGFRRVKGGKTPNIPKDVLLEILGPSKVWRKVIERVINDAVAEYVKKEGLEVSKDLRIMQSFEDLEVVFEPGKTFIFDAVIQLQK